MKTRNDFVTQLLALVLVLLMAVGTSFGERPPESVQDIKQRLDSQLSSLEALYKDIHSHPELSLLEEHTSARLARELRELGFEVTEKVGGKDPAQLHAALNEVYAAVNIRAELGISI